MKTPYYFLLLSLLSLAGGLAFGCIGAGQYIFPELFKELLPFLKIRPLHVTLVLCWIVLCATGGVYYCLAKENGGQLSRLVSGLSAFHFLLYLVTGIVIIVCFSLGIFGGREYMEYAPILTIPVLAGWIIFAVNYLITIIKNKLFRQVYFWMWGTGILFFIITVSESHLHLIPFFRDNLVRDMTVQWKSYGEMIGSWNMLVYGAASYLIAKTTGSNDNVKKQSLPFFLYFVGLLNLLFGWAHHTYILPTSPYIRDIAYLISMTELIILAVMIWQWKKNILPYKNSFENISFRFLYASDYWIVLNLILAILISVPAINLFTHGTHITVAHAMGTTIGINTSILLAFLFFILSKTSPPAPLLKTGEGGKMQNIAFFTFHISLFVFWVCMIAMGIYRSGWMYGEWYQSFREMKEAMMPVVVLFLISGVGILTGLYVMIYPALLNITKIIFLPIKKRGTYRTV